MAISVVGAGTVQADSGGNASLTVPLHASTADGDIVICFGYQRSNATGATISGEGTWNLLEDSGNVNGGRRTISWKVHQSGEGSTTFAHPNASANATCIAYCLTLRGVDTTTPIEVEGTHTAIASTQDIGPITGITPLTAGALVLVAGFKMDNWTSVATLSGDGLTWSEHVDFSSALGNDAGVVLDSATGWTSGAITSKTFTVTGGAAQASQGVMLSIKPASGAVTVNLGQVTETDTAQSVAVAKQVPLGQPTEADEALALAMTKSIALGLALETDTAQPVSVAKAINLGLAQEIDTALPLAVAPQINLGVAGEADIALPVAITKTVNLGLAEETEIALPINVEVAGASGDAGHRLPLLHAGD